MRCAKTRTETKADRAMAGLLFLAESVEYSMETSVASFFFQCATIRISILTFPRIASLASSSIVTSP